MHIHSAHCCITHGCKYWENDCPVVSGQCIQDHPCEDCDKPTVAPPKIVYGCPWIEVEFDWGERSEGWLIHVSEDDSKKANKKASREGLSEDAYWGPERPIMISELPFDFLPEEAKTSLLNRGVWHSGNYWQPSFRGSKKPA